PAGFDARAFLPCYGMAECSLAVSFSPLWTGPQVDRIDGEHLALTGEALPLGEGPDTKENSFVNCGRPLPGFEVEIRDADGRPLPDRRTGRIYLRGPSVMSGYFNNAEATADVLSADGWLFTGDLGYRVDGSLIISGRAKDLLIINGRNIWPQDIEHLAEQQPEVRPTDTSAFSVTGENGAEIAVLVVQCREPDPAALASLVDRLQQAIYAEFGIQCLIELVPPHTLPRTSSGKLSRSTARKEFLERHSGERLKENPRCLVSDGGRARAGRAAATTD
ncbi:MAG TPA: AMP-binding protein, partial [Nevskiaceae bacterium]|nr:AMP-binding protein [Nevskiaceae bacterium]